MIPVELRALRLRNEPASRKRNARNHWWIGSQRFFPAREVHCTGIWTEGHKLRKRHLCHVSQCRRGFEGFRPVAWQPEDERTEHVNAALAKDSQPLRQFV